MSNTQPVTQNEVIMKIQSFKDVQDRLGYTTSCMSLLTFIQNMMGYWNNLLRSPAMNNATEEELNDAFSFMKKTCLEFVEQTDKISIVSSPERQNQVDNGSIDILFKSDERVGIA